MESIPFLERTDMIGAAEPEEYVNAVRDAYLEHGRGAPTQPRTTLFHDIPEGMLTSYTAILPGIDTMGTYVYTAGFGDKDAWLLAALFNVETGRPLALLDGSTINPYKTGAVGAVGIDSLARMDASTVAIIGSGAQARGQLRAALSVRDIRKVLVYSPTQSHRESFAGDFNKELDATVQAVNDSTSAVCNADIVITATDASEPVVNDAAIQPGTHINAIGQYNPEKRELESKTIQRAIYVPDLRERAYQDAGSFLQALNEGVIKDDHIHAELGEIVCGDIPGRETDESITIFDSGGTAIETIAAAALVYRKIMMKEGMTDPVHQVTFSPASESFEGQHDPS